MKKYFVRAAKYMLQIFLLLVLVLLLIYVFTGSPLNLMHWFNLRLLLAFVLLGLIYPMLGFKRSIIKLPTGGRSAHEGKICEAVELSGFCMERHDGDRITFVAKSALRRLLTMHEDRITITFCDHDTIAVSGLRKDVARIALRIGDYIRYVK
jgi:hypothetical protein